MSEQKTEQLFKGLTNISEDLIVEAQMTPLKRKRPRNWAKAAAAAAVLLVLLNRFFVPGTLPQSGVQIPVLQPSGTGETKMIGLVVYKGGTYTDSQSYYGQDAEAIRPLLEERLGWARGDLDEWSPPEAYTKDFASSMTGEVYSVKGYSPDFRLGVAFDHIQADGSKIAAVVFVERLNGISLERGENLFTARLQMKDRIVKVEYQSHEDHDLERNAYKSLPVNSEDFLKERFLRELYAGRFIYIDPEIWDYTIGEAQRIGHLSFHLSDQTKIELTLYERGFVRYQGLPWHIVRIPEDVMGTVLDAIQ